jgi:hypothetical protein
MRLRRRHLLITAVLLAAAPAAAQNTFQPVQSQGFGPAPSQGFGAPPARAPSNPFDAPPQQQQEPPCFKEFSALRAETEKRGKALQEAGKRKVPPQEACKMFNGLMAAEAKLIKFTDENSKWCGIPAQVSAQLKESHTRVKAVRDQVCSVAARPAAPAGPTLSDALGTSRLPDSSNIRTGRGTFDTLTGTPLGQKN